MQVRIAGVTLTHREIEKHIRKAKRENLKGIKEARRAANICHSRVTRT